MKSNVVVGLIGPTLDQGKTENRWDKWRPTISIGQHEDFLVHEIHLLYQTNYTALKDTLVSDLKLISPETKIITHPITFNDPWDFQEAYASLHDFCSSFTFKPETNNYYLHITTGTHVTQICMFLLTESHHFPGKLLQTSPPKQKKSGSNPGHYHIIDLDLSKYDSILSRHLLEHANSISFLKGGIETQNKKFNTLIEQIETVAIRSKDPILLMGPTGSGKSELAKRIFQLKQKKHQLSGNFIEVNCATLKGDSSMSTLFGHIKGAYTGAIQSRSGLLQSADKGILFLDEIGELGLDEQAMLLRAIEDHTFLPVGSDKEYKSDFQLIAGTNKDLLTAVHNGYFREDLLARINLWTFCLPSLSQRPEDIEPNIVHEIDKFSKRHGYKIQFTREAKEKFLSFSTSEKATWNNNFRDLNAAITRMGTLANNGRIHIETVNQEISRLTQSWGTDPTKNQTLSSVLSQQYINQMDNFDKTQLSHVISICRQSQSISEAGRKLFNVSRTKKASINDADRLKKYLAKFNLSWKDLKA
ncbi:MAG TPA: RNA repair transcriptional activator RtcR [Oligoflexia bacterium]|nr:RNA repair transcriptional activator RtcR [Oligoflexia bacterium]HMR24162.1 RNA repair transcriptional activator RtcR [Oligoflexia bacterium]